MELEDGQTFVIGGLIQDRSLTSVQKVPVLGDIPFIGFLFQNRVKSTRKTELLVFITPKVVTDRSAAR